MLQTNKQQITQLYDCVKKFHNLEVLPPNLPDPQNEFLLPTLRPYQVKAVKWMLWKELEPTYYQIEQSNSSSESVVLLPRGGILAEEMGLGKTVEVLACILSNPRKMLEASVYTTNFKRKESVEQQVEKVDEQKVLVARVIDRGDEQNPVEDGVVEICDESNKVVCEDLKLDLKNETDEIVSAVECDLSDQSNNQVKVTHPCSSNRRITRKSVKQSCRSEKIDTRKKGTKRKSTDNESVQPKEKKKKVNTKTMQNSVPEHVSDTTSNSKGRRPKRESAKRATNNFALLRAWYEDCLSETSVRVQQTRKFQSQSTFQCCCVDTVFSDNIVECPNCKTWQHAECVGYDELSTDYEYFCFRCWMNLPPVVSAGTVIISPEAISQQWVSEIEKHVKKNNFKVIVYEGVRVNNYTQPYDLAKYDVVITTYQVLTRELHYTEPVSRSLRHAKRFYAPTSPLLCVQWWRLCLDEAQMVEGSTCRAAEMAKKFHAVNKWAVTGTPIQKAVNDLIGLMDFLAGKDYPEFSAIVGKDMYKTLMLVPRILWRTQMKDVLEETGVPPQTVETHLLEFSKIEKYFYQCTHKECSEQFLQRITRIRTQRGMSHMTTTLKELDRKVLGNLLGPLLKLRQACLHPQAVRGKFLSVKKTMTMEDLVSQMVTNAKLDAEQALRQLVSCLNGTAALHIIREEWKEAVDAYRTVLHLEQEHRPQLKIDSLQRIHTMHNLSEVLDGGYEGIPPTLRDANLREDIKVLESRYLGKREGPISATIKRLKWQTKKIKEQLNGHPLNSSDWWQQILFWSTDRDELLDRLKSAIQHTDTKQKNQYNNLANKLKSLHIVEVEIGIWLNEVEATRKDVLKWMKVLKKTDRDKLASAALRCHLPGTLKKGRTRCELCLAECELKKYEALLFEEISKQKRKQRNLPGGVDWEEDKDLDNKEVADLVDVNVNTFESSKKGGFKASPIEKLLQALSAYGRQKQVQGEWTNSANQQLRLVGKIKREFLELNLMWTQIFDLVDAKDELNMCKMRLRLPYLEEEQEMLSNKKKKKIENIHIIELYKVEPELHKLIAERTQFEADLKKKIGTMCYLENLQKEGTQAPICPICRNDLTEKWSVLQCGHCVCLECLSVILRPLMLSVPCPQCRQPCDRTDISYVESQPDTPALPPPVVADVRGNFSTKVDAVIRQTLRLIREQDDVKIIVFSTWEKVLDLLTEAYEQNFISFRRLKSGKMKSRTALQDFKTKKVTVLLLPLRSGAKGLNLVEATHVFLVEPILNPADELQAVGRVHRIGQTKPTVVHQFIVRDTIEERILAAIAASGAEQWTNECVTLQQLFDLFNCDLDHSLTEAEPGPSTSTPAVDSDSDQEEDAQTDDERCSNLGDS